MPTGRGECVTRVLPPVSPRVETGPVRFGEDSPGCFLRGSECADLIHDLSTVIDSSADPVAADAVMGEWIRLLQSVWQRRP